MIVAYGGPGLVIGLLTYIPGDMPEISCMFIKVPVCTTTLLDLTCPFGKDKAVVPIKCNL